MWSGAGFWISYAGIEVMRRDGIVDGIPTPFSITALQVNAFRSDST
jgi:hypothetical protein